MSEARYTQSFSAKQLARRPEAEQRDVMERWFREHYENPDLRTPYDSEAGDYVWIWGGPYDARQALGEEFDGVVPEVVIEALAETLEGESAEWAPVETDDDYDRDLSDVVSANANAHPTLRDALKTIRGLMLLETPSNALLTEALNRLLYANVITALETYLSDTFINLVLSDNAALRKYVETTPEFMDRKVAYSSVFAEVEGASDAVKRHLLDVVWHNLGKVKAMYKATLRLEFGVGLAEVARAIPKRHDIVHRNGKDADGNAVVVSADEVKALAVAVETLAAEIEHQLSERPVDVTPF